MVFLYGFDGNLYSKETFFKNSSQDWNYLKLMKICQTEGMNESRFIIPSEYFEFLWITYIDFLLV